MALRADTDVHALSAAERRRLLARLLRERVEVARQRQALSWGQRALWYLCQLDPAASAYNVHCTLRIASPVDADALERALQLVVDRHASLRSTFGSDTGRPYQEIHGRVAVPLLRAQLADAGDDLVRERVARMHAEPYDLARGPLVRAALFSRGAHDHVLSLGMHHLVCDAWSVPVVLEELALLYRAETTGERAVLPPVETDYREFVAWQEETVAGTDGERLWSFWRGRLAGAPPALELPTDRPRPALQTFRGGTVHFELPPELTARLAALARAEGASLFATLLTGFAVLLGRHAGDDEVLVGCQTTGRGRAAFQRLVGNFVNVVVLRHRLGGRPSFREALRQTRGAVVEALRHEHFPFPLLVERLGWPRDPSRSPVFQVAFNFQLARQFGPLSRLFAPVDRGDAVEVAGLALRPFYVPQQEGQFDLHCDAGEVDGSVFGVFRYNADLFDAASVERMAARFERLLAAACDTPERDILALPLATAAERRFEVEEANRTPADYGVRRRIHELIAEQAARHPDRVAVSFGARTVSYRDLDRAANRLAHALRALGVGPDEPVGVAAERSIEMVVALLGVLKAGGAYLPLDPEYPDARLAFMLRQAGARVVVAHAGHGGRLPAAVRLLRLDEDAALLAREPDAEPPRAGDDASLAYVIFTSGSTGEPKGVMVPHGAIRNRLLWMQAAYGLGDDDRVLQKTPFSFDVSVWEFFWPLMVGARLVVAEPGAHRDAARLVELVRDERITTLHFVPSMLDHFLSEPGVTGLRSLRRVFASGEALSVAQVERFHERLGTAELHNLYGPTEAAVDVSSHRCRPGETRALVPIGRPIANVALYVLDAEGEPAPLGVPGELAIGGVALARGYAGSPALTAEAFVPDALSGAVGARLYRTGDLVRRLADGTLEFLGRRDQQVKVRGFRIELGEVEAVLARHPAVEQCVVVARGASAARRLEAWVVERAGAALDAASLHEFLQARLPTYMVPGDFYRLGRLPLTASGKADRRALDARGAERLETGTAYEAPGGDEEHALAEVWKEVLGREQVGVTDDFFVLGGDSMKSLEVLTAARARGLHFRLRDFVSAPTIRDLARLVTRTPAEDGEVPASAREPFGLLSDAERRLLDGVEDAFPARTLQQGLVYHALREPESAVYHDVFSFELEAEVDEDRLRAGLERAMRRHPVLRSAFDFARFERPLQLVFPAVAPPLAVHDLSRLTPAAQDAALERFVAAELERRFDVSAPPLFRVTLHRRTARRFRLTLAFHHAILDGWSVSSLLNELATASLAGGDGALADALLAPPEYRYAEFLALEQAALRSKEAEAYWADLLDGAEPCELPPDPDVSPDGARTAPPLELTLPPSLFERLGELARREGVPLKSLVTAVHVRVIATLTGQSDVTTGSIVNGRPEHPDAERLLGLFLNTVPLRVRLGAGSWLDLARRLLDLERRSFPFRRYPLAHMPQGRGAFETVFNFVNFHVYGPLAASGRVEVHGVTLAEASSYPLLVNAELDPLGTALRFRLDYDPRRLSQARVRRIGACYLRAVEALVDAPHAPHRAASLLSDEERRTVLETWNATEAPFPSASCAHHLFEAAARRTPWAGALVDADRTTTYAELDARANQVAHRLIGLGVGPDATVAILMRRGPRMITSLLGVLKAGGAYVPLDPAAPWERSAVILEQSRARVVLVDEECAPSVAGHTEPTIVMDAAWSAVADEPRHAPAGSTTADDLAYVIFTSGSTGTPKGVAMSHRALCCSIAWHVERGTVLEAPRTVQFAALGFDVSVQEIFSTLCSGGALVLIDEETRRDPRALLAFVELHAVERIFLPVVVMHELARAVDAAGAVPPSLREVVCSGEQLEVTEEIRRFFERKPDCVLYNHYGPTEVHLVTCHRLDGPPAAWPLLPPIGAPITNARMYVLDDALAPVPLGVAGKLYVGGETLARGYFEAPGPTAERYLPDPFAAAAGARMYATGDLVRWLPDGRLQFLGRVDRQIKIRGHRVEPAEVEAEVLRLPGVEKAAVVPHVDARGGRYLAAFVVAAGEVQTDEWRRLLRRRLPEYMVPSLIEALDEMPTSPSGKIDRRRLPSPRREQAPRRIVEPRTATEIRLRALWEEVLDLRPIGVEDDFFDLGGHSLAAVRLVARIQAQLHREVPLSVLAAEATVAAVAAWLAREPTLREPLSSLVPLGLSGAGAPLHLVHPIGGGVLCYVGLARRLARERPCWAFQARGLEDDARPPASVRELAVHYVDLLLAAGRRPPIHLAGWSFGGHLAFEMACLLRERGHPVASLVLIDAIVGNPEQHAASEDVLVRWFGWELTGVVHGGGAAPAGWQEAIGACDDLPAVLAQAKRLGVLAEDTSLERVRRLFAVFRANVAALSAYRPGRYDGRMWLLRASEAMPPLLRQVHEDARSAWRDPLNGWGEHCAAGVEVVPVAGDHLSLLSDAHLPGLVESLRGILAKGESPDGRA